MKLQQIVREPLIHFLIIGLMIYGSYQLFQGDSQNKVAINKISIDNLTLTELKDSFIQDNKRTPNQQELNELIESVIKEEVLYREAKKMGLDKEGPVLRHCLTSEFSSIVFDNHVPPLATDEELESYLTANSENFRIEAVYSFKQVYLGQTLNDSSNTLEIQNLIIQLDETKALPDLSDINSELDIKAEYQEISESQVIRVFGRSLLQELNKITIGQWQGPVKSNLGMHLLLLEKISPGRMPPLKEVRERVEKHWQTAKRSEHYDRWYKSIRSNYKISLETNTDATSVIR